MSNNVQTMSRMVEVTGLELVKRLFLTSRNFLQTLYLCGLALL